MSLYDDEITYKFFEQWYEASKPIEEKVADALRELLEEDRVNIEGLVTGFLDRAKEGGIALSQQKLSGFLKDVQGSALPFVRGQFDILAQTIDAYSKKEITKAEADSVLGDMAKLWEMQALEQTLELKIVVTGLVKDLTDMVLKSIL